MPRQVRDDAVRPAVILEAIMAWVRSGATCLTVAVERGLDRFGSSKRSSDPQAEA